jgi:hypothetical protein
LPGSVEEAAQQQEQRQAELRAHPVKGTIEALAGPPGQFAEGLYAGAKRITGELKEGGEALAEGQPGFAAVHAVQAIPFVGAGIQTGVQQLGPNELINPAEVGTVLGTAAQVAPMLLGGGGEARPKLNLGVYTPHEPPMLPLPPAEPEYVGEPEAPPQPAGIPDAEVTPWEEAKQAQLPATTSAGLRPPPPVNRAEAVERTTPPPQFAPRPAPTAARGMIVDQQGNVLPVRPGLPPPVETAGRKTPIIAKPVPPTVQPGPVAPRLATPAVMAPAPAQAVPVQAAPSPAGQPTILQPNAPQGQPEAQRPVVQASTEPAEIRQSAAEQKPVLKDMAETAVEGIPGAKVEGMRVKEPEAVENKEDRGKPPETIVDHLGARVSAPTPEAVEQIRQNIESQLPVRSADKIDSNGVNADQYAVQTGMPGEPNQQSELQVVTAPVAEAMKATDDLYDQQKKALAAGDQAKADELGAQIAAKMQDAQQPELQGRAVLAESPEQTQLGNPPPKAGDTVAYQTNGGKTRNAKVVRVDGQDAYLRDGYATVKKPIASLKPAGAPAAAPVPQPAAPAPAKAAPVARAAAAPPPPVQQGQPAPGTPRPVGEPIRARIDQIKDLEAKGQKVVIFSAEADNPAVKEALTKAGLGNLPVTNIKGPDFGALLDNDVNVERNGTGPMTIPPVVPGKSLYVDFDGTLFMEPGERTGAQANAIEPRNGGQPSGPSEASGGGEKINANEIAGNAPRAVGQGPQGGAGVRERDTEGRGTAGAIAPAVEEKPLGQPGGGEKPEKVTTTKYKYGNTQADIPRGSEAGKALAAARAKIAPDDLMPTSNTSDGGGLEEDSHVTVRYGIDSDDTSGIRTHLEKQTPFEASLGKVTSFPPSEHSDGAAPIVVAVESPELRKLEKELDKHGAFVERSFPEYKPHATLAYVKPEAAQKYVGMPGTEGKKFTVNSISITDKNGDSVSVPLKGKHAPAFYRPKPAPAPVEKPAAPVKTEADAVAPGTAPPTELENLASAEQAAKEPKETPSALGSTTYAGGFLDPELFKTLFPDLAERFKNWATDEITPGDTQREMMRETRGERDRQVAAIAKKLQPSRNSWTFRPRSDSTKFFNAVESGDLSSLDPKDRALAQLFKGGFEPLIKEIQELKPQVLQSLIENYFPHIWEQPSMAAKTLRAVMSGRRPFAGSGSFLKQRTIPTIQDGLDMGLKPVSWNPVDLFLRKYSEMSQFLMGHKTLEMMKEAGTAKQVMVGKKAPDGWRQLDDRISTIFSYDDDDHLFIRGHYYAPPDVAKVFNNFVSRGLAGRSALYDVLRWTNNNLNSLQLGISAFHASTTAVNAATSEVALGIQKLSEGKPLEAAGHIISGATVAPSVIRTMVNGSRMMNEYLSPGSYRKFAAEASAVAEAGGRAKMDVVPMTAFRKTVNAFRNGAVAEGLLSLPGTVLQTTIAPVMDYMVPRVKLGAFYDMAHDILDEAAEHNWDEEATRRKMQRAWDSVDNRFGQLVYDNLFWHRALQDTLMLASRSVGWNFGDIRELGGGIKDIGQQAAGVFQGKMPEVTPRMAFAFALPLVTGLIGGVLTYLWTGHKPDTWKDYFYPKRQDGTRVSIPGYMKDVIGFAQHPIGTVTNKMSPLLEMTAEAINNRDFYGTEIRHTDDPYVKQLLQVSRWAAGQTEPFAISGGQKLLAKEGEDTTFRWAHPVESVERIAGAAVRHPGDLALGQLGFQPAPAFIQNSKALNMAREYGQANRPSGTKTQAEAEKSQAMHTIEDMYRAKQVNQSVIDEYKRSGVVNENDLVRARFYARTDPLVAAVRSLHSDQALNVYLAATPAEQKTLRPLIELKNREIPKDTPTDQQQQLKDAYRKALHPQPKFTGPSTGPAA